jgi:Gpi18-like mannosyltransferase
VSHGRLQADRAAWPVAAIVVGIAALLAGVVIRVLLLPTPGLTGDLDVFVLWTHGIAVNGLPHAYDQNLSFPPVMAYIWGILAAIEPAFKTVTDSSDPAIRALMKTPASLADLGLAALVAFALRDRPWWAAIGAAAILLHPAVIDISAWWGQYESIYLLSALIAAVFAINGRNGWAAAFLAVSIMTKPQALPLLVPFAAWFWATGGSRGFLRAASIGSAVIVVLWLLFIPADGPANYLRSVSAYQSETLNILSIRAWNLWFIVQAVLAGGHFVADDVPFVGPLTLRYVGLGLTALLCIPVVIAILRRPTPRSLILGCAAVTLISFSFLTTMHERYAFAAIGFLMLLVDERDARMVGLGFGIVFTLNLLYAQPPTAGIADALGRAGPIAVIGSIAMLALTVAVIRLTTGSPRTLAPDLAPAPDAVRSTHPPG